MNSWCGAGTGGEDRVYFHDAEGVLRSLPAGWTDADRRHPQPARPRQRRGTPLPPPRGPQHSRRLPATQPRAATPRPGPDHPQRHRPSTSESIPPPPRTGWCVEAEVQKARRRFMSTRLHVAFGCGRGRRGGCANSRSRRHRPGLSSSSCCPCRTDRARHPSTLGRNSALRRSCGRPPRFRREVAQGH